MSFRPRSAQPLRPGSHADGVRLRKKQDGDFSRIAGRVDGQPYNVGKFRLDRQGKRLTSKQHLFCNLPSICSTRMTPIG